MASAGMVQLPPSEPSGLQITSSYTSPTYTSGKQLASTSSFIGSLVPSAKALPSASHQDAASSWVQHPPRSSSRLHHWNDDPAVVAAQRAPAHSKLHKRPSSKKASSTPTPTATPQPEFDWEAFSPHIGDELCPSTTSSSTQASKPAKKSIRPTLPRLNRTKDGGDPTQIDLSRTTAENEEISGLAIQSQSPSSPIVSDVQFARSTTKARTHARSFSNTSAHSTVSRSFTPSAPFAQPKKQEPSRPYTPSGTQTPYRSSGAVSDASADAFGTPIEPFLSRNRSYTADTVASSATAPAGIGYRSPLRINTSDVSFARQSNVSQTSVSFSSSHRRPRGNTNRSNDTSNATPTSLTSNERALSFMRSQLGSSTRDTQPLNADTRQATIQAARHAFAQKEEAKSRKYERMERKAKEKETRKHAKQEDKKRRKSEPTTATRSKSAPTVQLQTTGPYGLRYTDAPPTHSASLPIYDDPQISSPRRATPQISKKRAAKGGYVNFLTWLKVRLLRVGTSGQ